MHELGKRGERRSFENIMHNDISKMCPAGWPKEGPRKLVEERFYDSAGNERTRKVQKRHYELPTFLARQLSGQLHPTPEILSKWDCNVGKVGKVGKEEEEEPPF